MDDATSETDAEPVFTLAGKNVAVATLGHRVEGSAIKLERMYYACRIERLLERVRGASERRSEMFLCDPRNQNGKVVKRLFAALEPMCQSGK